MPRTSRLFARAYAGLRIAEIVALDVADIRLGARKGSVRVRGKGRLGARTAPRPCTPRPAPPWKSSWTSSADQQRAR
ncbi:hypothetical protein KGD82_27880 (plasmid) [Nocardiopsis eucommiae]|uniref:Tyr recombinase domain-containing protein n=1 Tax=Nocardiopsis eucommiae TaxID=2831970 RepID=A0A975QMK3_9ACTN|nr:hypothetical protein KGD82_27880 [Nocardiopsis eucommiae]